jgi:OmcA/MtrC family decaheme c-type cytochrome
MTATWRRAAFGAAATAAVALAFGACGKARKGDEGNPGEKPRGNSNEFVVNPYGFTLQITGVDIPSDPTTASSPPTVTFTVADENGKPVPNLKDELGKAPSGTTPASGYPYTNAPRFTLARLDPGDDAYHNVYLNAAGNQAVSITLPRDPTQFDARVTSSGNGSYTFKLDPLKENPSADQRKQTWTAGVWGSRRATQQTGEDQAASSTLNFIPAGGGNPAVRQIVALGACNTCHAPAVRAHGTRLGTQLCLTCHTSQTIDPDTGNSVEFVELIHKIHYGGDRPVTATSPTYTIIGFQNAVSTFDRPWINDVRNCTLCHQGANADKRLSAPSQRACTTCHSVVKFDGSAGVGCTPDKKDTADCNHPVELAQGASCSGCHNAQKIESQHVSIFKIAEQFQYEIKGVTVGADRKPTVRFDVLDAATKQPRDLESDPAYKDPASSLNVQLGWPSKEFTNEGAAPTTLAPGQPRSIPVVRAGQLQSTVAKVAGQAGVYEVTSPVALPDGVTSATVFMDGHPVLRGENVPVTNVLQSFGTAAGAAGDARRQVVAVQNCNTCHGVVSAHGRNRNGNTQVCVVCHNPRATDWQKRQGTDAAATEQSVDFKVLIHGVHSGDIRHDPMIVYGFNGANAARGGAPGTPNEFPGEIPHGVANCVMCHTGTTYEPPLPAEALDTTIATNNVADPKDDTTLGKTQAVCTSCHDQVRFTEADQGLPRCGTLTPLNSAACFHSGGVQTSDASCASCHGRGGAADVTTVHRVGR